MADSPCQNLPESHGQREIDILAEDILYKQRSKLKEIQQESLKLEKCRVRTNFKSFDDPLDLSRNSMVSRTSSVDSNEWMDTSVISDR